MINDKIRSVPLNNLSSGYIMCARAAKALTSIRICANLAVLLLLADAILSYIEVLLSYELVYIFVHFSLLEQM